MNKFKGLALLVLATMLVASPALAQTEQPTQAATQEALPYTINIGTSKNFSKILVGPSGLTLYIFTVDAVNTSNCYDTCAKYWPPLLVPSADKLTSDSGIYGKVGTITRKDNTVQVTYNGWPLYYWSKDKVPGDTTGNRVTRNWWVVPPATVSSSIDAKLGSILVGTNGMTVYKFAKDTAGSPSTCTGGCATAWPALTVNADDLLAGVNLLGKVGTVATADGKLQVTYNGWPLYYFSKDKAIGDTMGEGVGNSWATIPIETVGVGTTAKGNFVTSYDGMTLYTFSKDTAGSPSTCTGDCAKAWPAFTSNASTDRLTAGTGVSGKLSTIKSADGKTLQVAYNGMPLYVFAKDKAPGDANGDGVGGVWSAVKP